MSGNGAICITCGKRPPRYGSVSCLTCSLAAIEKDPKQNRVGVAPTMEEAREEIRRRNGMTTKTDPVKKEPTKEPKADCKCSRCHKVRPVRFVRSKHLCNACNATLSAQAKKNKDGLKPANSTTHDGPNSAPVVFDHLKEQEINPAIGKAILEGMHEADLRITIYFTDHLELLRKITALAKKEFRLPEGQVMAILDAYLNGEGDA